MKQRTMPKLKKFGGIVINKYSDVTKGFKKANKPAIFMAGKETDRKKRNK